MDRLNRISSVPQVPSTTGRSPLRKVHQSDSAFATLLTEKTLEEERRKRKKQTPELEELEESSQLNEQSDNREHQSPIHPENWGQKAEVPISDIPLRPQDIQPLKAKVRIPTTKIYSKSKIELDKKLILERTEEVRTPVRLPSERTMPIAAVEPLVDKKV